MGDEPHAGLKPHACRFPMWEDGEPITHEYCGAQTYNGSSYCAEHHEVTHMTYIEARNFLISVETRFKFGF